MRVKSGAVILLALLAAAGCATQPAAVVTTTPAATLPEQDAVALAEKFYDLFLTRQDYAEAVNLFDDQMKTALPEGKLKEAWDSLPQRVGSFQSRQE